MQVKDCQVVSSLRTGGMERMVWDLLAVTREETTDYRLQNGEVCSRGCQPVAVPGSGHAVSAFGWLRRDQAGAATNAVAEPATGHAVTGAATNAVAEPATGHAVTGAATNLGRDLRTVSCLFCTDAEGELYESAPVAVKACGHRKPGLLIIDWRLVRQLVRFVRQNKVDILHAHNHAPNLYCTIVSLLTGIPVVVTRHGRGYDTLRWKILSRVLSWRSRAVVFVSEDAKRLAISTGSVSPRKAIVIHNGVDTRRFAPRETLDRGGDLPEGPGHGLEGPRPNGRGYENGRGDGDGRGNCSRRGYAVDAHEGGGHVVTDAATNDGRGANAFKSNVYGLKSNVSSSLRSTLGIPPNAVIIGSVGRLSPEKNYPLLVRAFGRLLRGETTDHKFQTTDYRLQTADRGEDGGGETTGEGRQTTDPVRTGQVEGVQSSVGGQGLDLNVGGAVPAATNLSDRRTECASHIEDRSACTSKVHCLNLKVFLLLVGDGPERGRIEAEMERCVVKDRCLISGMQPDVRPWLQAMDIFCLSSDTEGLSISLIEAAACGLPAVVTDVGGNREVVVQGETGMMTPKGDESSLSAALRRLVGDGALRVRMGVTARRRMEDEFSLDRMVEAYGKVYDKIAVKGGGSLKFALQKTRDLEGEACRAANHKRC